MKNYARLSGLLLLFLGGCIGTDILDWEVMDARVVITTRLETLAVGETFQLEAEYFDSLGQLQTDASVVWTSSDESIISVDDAGIASAHEAGEVTILAQAGPAQDTLTIVAGDETTTMEPERKAMLQGLRNYDVEGTVTLKELEDGSLKLEFSSDFSSDNGPGLYVYLSNNATNVAGGVEVAQLAQTSGAHEYDVPAGVSLDSYNYVLIYCRPFGVGFGNGEFED
ncbi:MAG TPA: hypothetical protein DCE41_09300 [Cytophagales bacterium]|nr:hypothetical protein [Cytophagales bacterium]HAA21245.1 hypothetical protein [Cytophagales bacterium]HAP62432.1 hypothetical protein [Cytophagales bacterium]